MVLYGCLNKLISARLPTNFLPSQKRIKNQTSLKHSLNIPKNKFRQA